jgi:hypothetical protein
MSATKMAARTRFADRVVVAPIGRLQERHVD